MRFNPYLTFNGQCEEALRFYAQSLGGRIEAMMTYAGSPAEGQVPPEWRSKILHARFSLGEDVLMASDAPPGRYQKPQGISISLQVKDARDGKRLFEALAEGGSIGMPFQKTFWSSGFGMLTDRFGIPWMVNCEQPA